MKPLSLKTEQMKAAGLTVSRDPTHCGHPASGMDSESLQMYKQKTEQMSTLIRHYQTELESQKVCRDGVETVSRLLAESRQENVSLKKQHAALQMMVKNLQNRLAVNGVTSVSEGDDTEVIMPGTSKQTLTNLALENKRLRSLLQQENSSEVSESLQKTIEDTASETQKSLQHTVDQLEAENHSMKQKLSDLECLFKSSNNEKDRQLIRFQEEIQRLSKQKGEATTADKTVTRVSALKEQLKALMAQCASFESHLESVQETESQPEKKETVVELVPVLKQNAEQTDSMDGVDVKQLLEEKQKLKARVEEVTQMNQRWQEFFNERDRYTKSLEHKVQELDAELKKTMHSGTTPEMNRRIEQALQKSQVEIGHMDDLRRKAEEEAEHLRHDLALRDTQLSQLQNQMTILSRVQNQQSSSEAQSTIDHLKAQIQVCTEDFEKERQDREMALQKVASLQEQNSRLQKLSNHFQTLLNQTQRPAVTQQCHQETGSLFHQQPRMTFGQSLLAFDGPSSPIQSENCRDYSDFDFDNANKAHPGPVSLPASTLATTTMELLSRGLEKPRHSLSDSALNTEAGKKESFLTCPKCNKEFSEEHQGELLAHMDVCWE